MMVLASQLQISLFFNNFSLSLSLCSSYREALAAEPLEHFVHRFGGLRQHGRHRGGRGQVAVGADPVQGGCQQRAAQEAVVAALRISLLDQGHGGFQNFGGRGRQLGRVLAVVLLGKAGHLGLVPCLEHRFRFERNLVVEIRDNKNTKGTCV